MSATVTPNAFFVWMPYRGPMVSRVWAVPCRSSQATASRARAATVCFAGLAGMRVLPALLVRSNRFERLDHRRHVGFRRRTERLRRRHLALVSHDRGHARL